jgi:WD40 repeat protein
VPGLIRVSGYRNKPLYRDLSAMERLYWKNLPFLSKEERYKDVVWEGSTPVRIKVSETRELYMEDRNETGHTSPISSLSTLEDADIAYSVDTQHRVCTWNPLTGEKLSSLAPKPERNLLITTSCGVVLGGYETSIRVWHKSGEVQYVLGNPSHSRLERIQLTPKRNVLVALAANGNLMSWEFVGSEDQPFKPLFNSKLPQGKVTALASANFPLRIAVGLSNGEMILWPEENLLSPVHRRITTAPITALAFSEYGPRIVMADATGGIYLFRDEMDRRPEGFRLKDSRNGQAVVGCLAVVSPDGHILAGDNQGMIQVWNGNQQELIKVVRTGIPGLHSMAVNRAHNLVMVAGAAGGIVCYSLDDLVS